MHGPMRVCHKPRIINYLIVYNQTTKKGIKPKFYDSN